MSLLACALLLPAQAAQRVEFNIPALALGDALTLFGVQSGLTVIYSDLGANPMVPPVTGSYEPGEVLDKLLAQTGLRAVYLDSRTVTVSPREPPAHVPAADDDSRKSRQRGQIHYSQQSDDQAPVAQVTIDSTRVRFMSPVGTEVLSVGRADTETAGAATVPDFLRTVPQVFGGGPNQDTHIGTEALTNSGLGVGLNLRGLGAGATVILVNGRRLAPSGSGGEFTDVMNIPLSAVEHIDLLPYDATAFYGADAVGGVVNFIMRDNFSGAETLARAGSGTRGDLQEYLFAQTLGKQWDGGAGLISFEYYRRGPLPAADRSYAVSNLRPFGGGDFDTNMTNPGNIVTPVTGLSWAIPAGQNGTHLAATQLVAGTENLQDTHRGAEIIPSQERWNLYANGRQELSDRLAVFTDVLLGYRVAAENHGGLGYQIEVPATNPFYINPMRWTSPVLVDYNFGKDLGPLATTVGVQTTNVTLGLDFDAGGSWTVSAYGNYSREQQNQAESGGFNFDTLEAALADPSPATAFNPFGDGSHSTPATLSAIAATGRFWLNSALKVLDINADGPVWSLPGGPLSLAVGVDRREQYFGTATNGTDFSPASRESLSREVTSIFSEWVAPLFGASNGLPGLRKLELSAAARYENYAGHEATTTPKFGLVWSPLQGIALRGTWARSMRPPPLADLDANHNSAAYVALPDSAAGGATNVLVWSGGNPVLGDERATSWTTGLDVAPDALPGFSLGVTYFNTAFRERIEGATFGANVLTDPGYAAIVTRNPSAAQIDYICDHSFYSQGTTASCKSVPTTAIVDLRVRNLATLLTHGIDFGSAYEHSLGYGTLRLGVSGTWIMGFQQAETPTQSLTSVLNTQNNPVNLRLRGSAGWQLGGVGAVMATNFTNSYRDVEETPVGRIASWTTIDLQLHYDFATRSGSWLSDTRIGINAQNVFNVDPPFLNNQVVGIGYDQENANPYGRTLSLQIRKHW